MTVDFLDDMIPMPWDRQRLRKFMRLNAKNGLKRICWIYHGDRDDGFWENTGTPWRKNFLQTFDSLQAHPLRIAVMEARDAGMEIFAIYKPFDLAVQNFPVRKTTLRGRIPVAGGALGCAFNFAVNNPDALMRRRPAEDVTAERIVLNSAEKLTADHQFQLWESDDNWTYRRVGAPVAPEENCQRVVFNIAERAARFFAIESLSSNAVSNRIDAIVTVESTDGKPVRRALGLVPRKYRIMDQTFHLKHEFDEGGGFSQEGFFFDYLPGIPTATCPEGQKRRFNLSDNGQNVVGVSLDINERVPGAPEPAEPKAVEYWLSMIQKMLDYGVDGVDIRITNHNSILEWCEYGFNPPVVEAYKKRHGVDPMTETVDMEKWRRLRGEFHTAFLEKAAALVKGAGKRLCLHVPDRAFGSPEHPTMMDIHWDWRDWLEKGIPDEVTFKIIKADNAFSTEACELIERCRAQGVPVSACPFIHAIENPADYLESIEQLGVDAFTIYEAATLWQAVPDGFRELRPLP